MDEFWLAGATRRGVLRGAGALAAATALRPRRARAAATKIGYVTPQTGPLAPFAAADDFVLAAAKAAFARRGQPVEILVRDSQSNPNRAGSVASELINADVSLMLVASTPETTNPVGDQCELAEVPCISTVAPWQPWFFGRGGKPGEGFAWTYHFFWGLEDVIAVFAAMWGQVATDKVVGGLFPNDGDGNAWGDPVRGFAPALAKQGFTLRDPGRFQDGSDNFGAQIAAFQAAHAEIVTGVVIPPDWTTFWTQARQQGFRPKIASVGKALLFPSSVEALGAAAQNLSSEVWWSPRHPFASSLTGQSCAQLAADYTARTGRQWTQPIGFVHALFELAADVLKRAHDPSDREAVLAALTATRLATIVGPIAWGGGPVKNVAKTPLAGGQWRATQGGQFPFDLVITTNAAAPGVPVADHMQPIA
jgi:branched-chain amino acid transport system substrate-binding protein